MAYFHYLAADLQGKQKRGTMQTANPETLRTALRENQLYLISYTERTQRLLTHRMRAQELADFCREMGTMLGSGVTVVRALTILSLRPSSKAVKQAYVRLLQQLRRGVVLSEAMEQQGNTFPQLLIHMIRTGEASGTMDLVFEKLAVHYDNTHRLRSEVKSAMTYPILLLCLLVVVMLVLFTFVLPKFFPLFDGIELPLLTQIVVAMSDGIRLHFGSILLCILCLLVLLRLILRSKRVHCALDRYKLRLPYLGHLFCILATTQFSETLASLYAGGIPMLQAISIAGSTVQNAYICSRIDEMVRGVRAGNALSAVIAEQDCFDPKLAQTIAVGEESGALDRMLRSVADSFAYESKQVLKKLLTILEPLMIVILALLVLVVIGAVMLPIYMMYGTMESRY